MKQAFVLQPFEPVPLQLSITGEIARTVDGLQISYHLAGDLSRLLIPAVTAPPQRRFELWEATCLEFFVAPLGEPYYWEFNMSPSGDWNVFRLDGYRQGLRNEEAVLDLPMVIERKSDAITLDLQFDLEKLVTAEQTVEVAITTVIQDQNHNFSYWALQHTGQAADFHRRADFSLKLA
jgi:hypothetical protein